MGQIATGINKLLTFNRQSGLGVIADIADAQNLRRTTSTLDKKKANYTSKELKPSQQISDMRHGVVSVDGTISGEVSVGTYQAFIESVCRRNVAAAITSGAMTNLNVTTPVQGQGVFTRASGDFLAASFKIGMIIRGNGWTAPAIANNNSNFLIIGLTATIMTVVRLDNIAIVAKASGDSITLTEVGCHTYVPQTGHTRDYYTIEHNFKDVGQTEQFVDCVISQMDVKLPASGMSGIDFMVKGRDMKTGTVSYFTNPSPVSLGNVLAAANGIVVLQGQVIGLITGLNFSIKGNHTTAGGVVGSNIEPDIFAGTLTADGQMTVLFTDNVVRDYFLNENEVEIYAVFTTDNTPAAGFQAYSFPRVKLGGATKDDGDKGLVMTVPFTALEKTNGGPGTPYHRTTFFIQDSAFVLSTKVAPTVLTNPSVDGQPQTGVPLFITAATFNGSPTPTISRQIYVANVLVSSSMGYTPVTADQGKVIKVVDTASNSQGTIAATSADSAAIVNAVSKVTDPSISGTPTVNTALVTNWGTYTGYPAPTTQRSILANGTVVAGPSANPSYTPVNADIGKAFSLSEIATNSVNNITATSANSAACVAAPSVLTTSAKSKSARASIVPASNAPTDAVYTITTSPAGGVDYSAGTGALNRVIGNLVDGTQYTLIATSTSTSQGAGPSSAGKTVTPTTAVPTKTTQTDTLAILPGNNANGVTTAWNEPLRTKLIIKAPAENTVSIQVSPNSKPNNNGSGDWTEVYQLDPGMEIEVTGDTRRWQSRLLGNVTVYGQKLIVESEVTVS